MSVAVKVTRVEVLAYRVAAQELHRGVTRVGDLAVLDLGIQEAMGQPAGLAFAARLDTPPIPGGTAIGPGHPLALAWTLRGAPHVHRRADLDSLARALYPLSEQDAQSRLHESGPAVARHGIAALDQFATAVRELRGAIVKSTAKGAASTAVSQRLPAAMLRDCRSCKASHVSDSAMRLGSLAAGIELEPGTSPPVLTRRKGTRVVRGNDLASLRDIADSYLHLLGPATLADFAGFLEGRRADVAAAWPADLVEVQVDGRRAFLPGDRVAALRTAPEPDVVRLLGPFDPYLQARDRDVIVPDKRVHKTLWPVLGRPGVLLADGEIAGVWRTKTNGTKLTITVEPFGPLPKSVWTRVDDEAARVGVVRAASQVSVNRVE